MSWLSSALTPSGSSAANTSSNRSSHTQRDARSAFHLLNPALQSQATFATQLEPQRQRSVWDSINATNPWGVQNSISNARAGFQDQAIAGLPGMEQALSQGGAGIGALQGARYAAMNNANSQANDMLAYWASPQGRQALAQMSQQAILQGQSMPSLDAASQLASLIYGRPQVQVGGSPIAGLAGLGAQLFGAGAFG